MTNKSPSFILILQTSDKFKDTVSQQFINIQTNHALLYEKKNTEKTIDNNSTEDLIYTITPRDDKKSSSSISVSEPNQFQNLNHNKCTEQIDITD